MNGSQQITFEYNEDGLRQRKTVNGTDTDYFYNGSVLIGMQRGSSKFLFSYDAAGNVVSVKYNGNEYYYVRNGQGDIVKLIDSTGTTVVEYIYNTWGKKVTTTGSLAGSLGLIQPFRYRGYVYDFETGFYYLESRYYDPTTGRFISADVLLSTGQGVIGNNAYAYCLDNPANMCDDGGSAARDLALVSEEGGGGDPPPNTPKVIVLTIPEFEVESYNCIHCLFHCKRSEVRIITFTSYDEFENAWNGLVNPSAIVVINAHGSPYSIGLKGEGVLRTKDVSKLRTAKMRALVLLCCSNGQIEYAETNMANAFATLVDVPVYASDGNVLNIIYWSFWNLDFDFSTPLRLSKGWFVYEGGNGNHRKVSNIILDGGDI